ncbi:BrnA antitoxin family protein [Paracoccus sp. p3-h83]|uniref:BrnA antitoxin family protein n=1 Tax=Paracoccus sp. p3-h83 TaxID=3342805 RepID=UPI0035B8BF61
MPSPYNTATPEPPPSKAEAERRAHYHALAETYRDLEVDLRWGLSGTKRIPDEWSRIAATPATHAKRQVSLRVDQPVLAFFKAMGPGYLTRMNAVLRAFMHARLSRVVGGPEHMAYRPLKWDEERRVGGDWMDAEYAKLDLEAMKEAFDPEHDDHERLIARYRQLREERLRKM